MYAYQLSTLEKENLMVAKKIAAAVSPHRADVSLTPGAYRTRAGKRATILSAGVPGEFSLIGYIEAKNGTITPTTWRPSGKAAVEPNDLVAIWSNTREVTIDLYVGLDDSGAAVISYNPPKEGDFIGLRKFTVTVKEGDTPNAGEKKT